MMTPMTFSGCTREWRNDSAIMLGVKLCSRAYCWIAARRSAEMRGESFRARDTVATLIPNSRAISFIVSVVFSAIWFLVLTLQSY